MGGLKPEVVCESSARHRRGRLIPSTWWFGSIVSLALGSIACGGSASGGPYCSSDGERLIEARCSSCHAADRIELGRAGAPDGVNFDTAGDIRRHAGAIRALVDQGRMPPGGALPDCEREGIGRYLLLLEASACTLGCSGRFCGDDGCGGSCGECAPGQSCTAEGQCVEGVCVASCEGRACGSDGCDGGCGECEQDLICTDLGSCECIAQCHGRICGPDGCGGSCGRCAGDQMCAQDGTCRCVPSCDDKACGSNGCSGECGTCPPWETCTGQNSCACVPACADRECGSDSCGGSCGTCSGALICNTRPGTCENSCTADCAARACGDDGCGGTCGSCAQGDWCTPGGACECTPSCMGRACGDDGCGGSCGDCDGTLVCDGAGQCGCQPECTARECGEDGCGGSCGDCAANVACDALGHCASCTPNCDGAACGADGCGGSCGTCESGQTCTDGTCGWIARTFAADVFPIFEASTCSNGMCHDSDRPAESLNLSSSSAAYAGLVGVAAEQCSDKLLVAAGDSEASYLVNKLTGVDMCSGARMPKAASALSTSALQTIRAWIATGAAP